MTNGVAMLRRARLALCLLFLAAPTFAQQIEGENGGASLTVKENDNLPTVSNVTSISVNNGTLTDNGGGSVTISLPAGSAPADATYITQTANGSLSNEQALSALPNGCVGVTTTTNNDGFGIFSLIPFNIVSLVIGTAGAGGSPAWDLAYTLAGGTWGTISNAYVAPLFTATGEQLIWFEPPVDWAVSEAGHGTGVPVGYYGIRSRATTAPSGTAALATSMVLGRMLMTTEAVGDNAVLNNIGGGELALPAQCDAICAAISVANSQNRASVNFRYAG